MTPARRDLRRRAEDAARVLDVQDVATLPTDEVQRLFHELQVHQIELEMQNEELRQAHRALDTSRARYFDLYDLAPLGYVTCNPSGTILETNLAASSMLGVHRHKLGGQAFARFIAPPDQDAFYAKRRALLHSGDPLVCEVQMKPAVGPRIYVRLEASASPQSSDEPAVIRITMSNITENRALQASLAQADRMANMGVLAAGVAHEINNPLTYLLYNMQSLAEDLPTLASTVTRCIGALDEALGPEVRERLAGPGAHLLGPEALDDLIARVEESLDGVNRIHEIAGGLSVFSRVDRTNLTLVDLNVALRSAARMAHAEIKARAVLVEHLGQVPLVTGSEGKLAQVFLNLLINATHSLEEGAIEHNRITIRTWTDTGQACAEVIDTGCGIPHEDLEAVFKPFFTTKTLKRGTGLGLSITKTIVNDLGGVITVESAVGKGTRFALRFPPGGPKTAPPPPPPVSVATRRGRVLIIDDEPMVRRAIEKFLGKEHEVVSAASGLEAKPLFSEEPRFDVILCDLMMPGISGIELHQWLTEHHPRLAERVVFITGGVYTPNTQAYLDAHPNPCVDKPFDTGSLRTLVGDMVDQVAPPTGG